MAQPIFITGIGTGIGKTLVSAIVAQALEADYWKPVQAGFEEGTDSDWVKQVINNRHTRIHQELYKLALPVSPHIAARKENIIIDIDAIADHCNQLPSQSEYLIIEGAGGLMVPLNSRQFVVDLVQAVKAKVILVSRNYLGSINHSLLTAEACKQRNIDVAGWIFNDQFMQYENEIVQWTGYPSIGSIPFSKDITSKFVDEQAQNMQKVLKELL